MVYSFETGHKDEGKGGIFSNFLSQLECILNA